MQLGTRRVLDRAFAGTGALAIILMVLSLVVILAPIFFRGLNAVAFRGTIEHRRVMMEKFERGDRRALASDMDAATEARAPLYRMLAGFEREIETDPVLRRRYAPQVRDFKKNLAQLLGPVPGGVRPMLMRDQFGQTRWDRAQVVLERVLYRETWDYSDPTKGGVRKLSPRRDEFAGTTLAPAFDYIEANIHKMLRPRMTLYWQFLLDGSYDAHFFGGIGPELLGTVYLTVGAMLFAVPMGIIAAIFLAEYAGSGRLVGLLRMCISTLAGVPSIVFGLFGLAFFINTMKVSNSKSVLAGSLTLALMILPTIIRAAEEAICAVPRTYKEAALSLGAGRGRTIMTVIIPAALPGILTGIVISMGRAAGETAPIIFTAAVSVGDPLNLGQLFSSPTPALSWNIYNLATEHEAVDAIRHVQYGMVLALVALVLALNITAIILRARITRKLRG